MQEVRELLKQFTRVVVSLVLVAGIASVAAAWTGPSATPPANNTLAPINVGATAQSKAGFLGVNGAGTSYPISASGVASNWTAVFNWPYNTTPSGSLGVLAGGTYSEFENPSGYYSLVAYSSYGLYTNGGIYAAGGYYGPGAFGGGYQLTSGGGCYVGNALTGGCSCPGYAPNGRWAYYMDTNSTYGGGRGYVCTG